MKASIKNKQKHKIIHSRMNGTTIISLTMVLLLVGIISLLGILAKSLADHVKESISFSVVIKDQTSEVDAKRIQKSLQILEYVKDAKYITKEDALKEYAEQTGDDINYMDYNPLLASIEVKLNSTFANEATIQKIIDNFKGNDQIKEVVYQKDLLHAINKNITTISVSLAVLAALLILISLALINNTIRLGVHAQRFQLRTMQLVGANASFIRKPFIRKNVQMGLIASILAIIALVTLIYSVRDIIQPLLSINNIDKMVFVLAFVFICGIVLTYYASWRSVNHYLHAKQKELHR